MLETDAFDDTMTDVLSQRDTRGKWHAVSYCSQTMSAAERNYPIHDKEFWTIVLVLEKWRTELEGLQSDQRFSIYTDHHALKYFMTKKQLNVQQARWSEHLSRFHFIIKYQPGKDNIPADILTHREGS